MARTWETEISKVRVFTLKLTSVSFGEQYIDPDCTILKEGTISNVVKFEFRDCYGNIYTHYQVPPSEAASASKAGRYFSVISNGKYHCVDFLSKDPLEPFRKYCGCYYSCMIRRRKSIKNGKEVTHFDVDDFFYPFAFVESSTFDKTKPRDTYNWEIDLKETRRTQKKKEEFLKMKEKMEEEEMARIMKIAEKVSERKLY